VERVAGEVHLGELFFDLVDVDRRSLLFRDDAREAIRYAFAMLARQENARDAEEQKEQVQPERGTGKRASFDSSFGHRHNW
jgi:hypothetical protein